MIFWKTVKVCHKVYKMLFNIYIFVIQFSFKPFFSFVQIKKVVLNNKKP